MFKTLHLYIKSNKPINITDMATKFYTPQWYKELREERALVLTLSNEEVCKRFNADSKEEYLELLDDELSTEEMD